MRDLRRLLAPLALAVLVTALAPDARGSGAISTAGATIAAGAAPAGGTVTIDACAAPVVPPLLPAIDPIGSVGFMTGTMPAFAGAGAGGPVFVTGMSQTLPGGTYSYASYHVTPGMSVTYTGPVTIQTTGDVRIDGLVTTIANTAPITIHCGGNFQLVSHSGVIGSGVTTTGLNSPVTIDAAGTFATSTMDTSAGAITTVAGAVTLLSHSTTVPMNVSNVTARAFSAGDAVARTSLALAISSATLQSDGGNVIAQAYGGDLNLQAASVSAGNNLLLECSGAMSSSTATSVVARNSLTMTAFGGNVAVFGGALVSQSGGTGDVAVAAGADVIVSAASRIENLGIGGVTVTAFGGGVTIEPAASSTASFVRNSSAHDVSVRAADGVVVAGSSQVASGQGGVVLRAVTGAISLVGDASVTAPLGAVDVRAATSVTAAAAAVSGPDLPQLTGQSVLVRGGAGGVSIATDALSATSGALTLIADGPLVLGGNASASGALTVQSTGGDVNVSGRSLTTGGASGDILIESFGGAGAAIDATNATVRSGDHATASGDVTLRVYAPGSPASDGALFVSRVQLKTKSGAPARSRLTVNGVLDTGTSAVDLAGAATLSVGDLSFPVQLAADSRGRAVHRDDAVNLRITPSRVGSSRAAFTLTVIGDFSGFLDAGGDGSVALEFARGALDAAGAVRLVKGSYVRGGRGRALIAPKLVIATAHAVAKDGANDKLDFAAGFSIDGAAPTAAPDVTVSFGDAFGVTIASAAFVRKSEGVFAASDPARGVQSLVLDFGTQTLTFRGRKIELGAFGPGLTVAVRCEIRFGTDVRSFSFRMAHRGSALIY